MAKPTTRQQLIDYCLRQLGAPVLEINVDNDQLEDRVDDAFQFFQDYHFDATQKVFLKHLITPSTLNFYSNQLTGTFTAGEIVTGGTTNATAIVVERSSTTSLKIRRTKDGNGYVSGVANSLFSLTETVTGSSSGATGKVSSLTLGDVDNQYIPIDDSIIGVERVLPFDHAQSDVNMFDVRYQLHLNDVYDLSKSSLVNYDFTQRRLSYLENIFNQAPSFSYSRHMDKLYLNIDWEGQEARVDKFVVLEVYKILEPSLYTQVYNDMFLKKYLTQLFKKQWGTNLIKFEGMQLPGGVTLNGRQLYDDAVGELEKIEEDVQLRYQLPDDFMVG